MSAAVVWLRRQYPQYSDLPDSAIVAGFKQKYYPDVDQTKFQAALDAKAGRAVFEPMSTLKQSGAVLGKGAPSADVFGKATALAPYVGGALGAAIGTAVAPPFGGIPGAGVGAWTAEGLRQMASGQRYNPGQVAAQGLGAAAGEAAGMGLGAGAAKLAPMWMNFALRPGKEVLGRFPNAMNTAVSEGLTGDAAGLARATARGKAAVAAVDRLRADAAASGQSFMPSDVTREAQGLLSGTRLDDAEKALVSNRIERFKKLFTTPDMPAQPTSLVDPFDPEGTAVMTPRVPGVERPMTPDELKIWKQKFQARAGFGASPTRPVIASPMTQLLNRKLAAGAQRELETIPGMHDAEARVQDLMGAQRAVSNATMRPPVRWLFPAAVGAAGGAMVHGAEGGLVGSALMMAADNPAIQSRLALMLAHPTFQNVLHQSPRFAAAMLLQSLQSGAPSDATGQVPGQ